MPVLEAKYDSEDDVPEDYKALFTEKDGAWELTEVGGIRTQADVDRVQESLRKEKSDRKKAKSDLKSWTTLGELSDVQEKLDRFPELEAAAGDKLDEDKIEGIVTKRVEARIAGKLTPVQRQLDEVTEERDILLATNDGLVKEKKSRKIGDEFTKAFEGAKALKEARPDALLLANSIFEVRDDDEAVVTKEGLADFKPGLSPKQLMLDIEKQQLRPLWWGEPRGAGSQGSRGVSGRRGSNPFSHEDWNVTKQGQVIQTEGRDVAGQMAKAAGTTVGGRRPSAKK